MYIYLITNKINGKYYVGQTKRKVQERWKNHISDASRGLGTYFASAIRKHCVDNFTVETLCTCPDKESLNEAEKFFIRILGSNKSSIGYNLTTGGSSFEVSESTKRKMSRAKMGKPRSRFTEQHRENISQALLGKERPDLKSKRQTENMKDAISFGKEIAKEVILEQWKRNKDLIEAPTDMNSETEVFFSTFYVVVWPESHKVPLVDRTFADIEYPEAMALYKDKNKNGLARIERAIEIMVLDVMLRQ